MTFFLPIGDSTGAVSERSTDHPYLLSLRHKQSGLMPVILDHWLRLCVSPLKVIAIGSEYLLGGCSGGILTALSGVQPLASLPLMVSCGSPDLVDQSFKQCVSPRAVIQTLLQRFLSCSWYVAHRQLSGEYPLVPSLRSIVCFGVGFLPMSARKLANCFQRSQMDTPLAPYLGYAL